MKTMGRTLYQCSVCDANPSKRHNVERHVWLQHVRKWMNLRTQEYQVSLHKKYVERYVRKQSEAGGTPALEDFPPGEYQPMPFKDSEGVSIRFEQDYEDATCLERPDRGDSHEEQQFKSDYNEGADANVNGDVGGVGYSNTLPSLPLQYGHAEASPETTPQSRLGSPPQSPNSGISQTLTGEVIYGDIAPIQGDVGITVNGGYSVLDGKDSAGFANVMTTAENTTPSQDEERGGNNQTNPVYMENFLAHLAQANVNQWQQQAHHQAAGNVGTMGNLATEYASAATNQIENYPKMESYENSIAAVPAPNSYTSLSPPHQTNQQTDQQAQAQVQASAFFLHQMQQMQQMQQQVGVVEGSMFQLPTLGPSNPQLENIYLHMMAGYGVGINPAQFRASS